MRRRNALRDMDSSVWRCSREADLPRQFDQGQSIGSVHEAQEIDKGGSKGRVVFPTLCSGGKLAVSDDLAECAYVRRPSEIGFLGTPETNDFPRKQTDAHSCGDDRNRDEHGNGDRSHQGWSGRPGSQLFIRANSSRPEKGFRT